MFVNRKIKHLEMKITVLILDCDCKMAFGGAISSFSGLPLKQACDKSSTFTD